MKGMAKTTLPKGTIMVNPKKRSDVEPTLTQNMIASMYKK